MERQDGILLLTFHTDDGPLQWGSVPHDELGQAFRDVGSDPDNRVVIMTGTGEMFSGPRGGPGFLNGVGAERWAPVHWQGRELLFNLLRIEAPMISAINGPALRHAEIPLLCDIVLASENAEFQDSAHFVNGMVPGDGMHVVLPLLMGWNRGRYFLLTGQSVSAESAREIGLVNEVLPPTQLLPRAWELAEQIAKQPPLTLRYTRLAITMHLQQLLQSNLGYGLALEGLAANALPSSDGDAG